MDGPRFKIGSLVVFGGKGAIATKTGKVVGYLKVAKDWFVMFTPLEGGHTFSFSCKELE